MIIEKIATGETIEEAVANAKALLGNVGDAIIHTEILEMPKKKMLGLFGGSPAKVKASADVLEKASKPEKPKPVPMPKKENAPRPKADPKKNAPKPLPVKAEKGGAPKKEKAEEPAPAQTKEKIEISSSQMLTVAADYVRSIVSSLGVEKCDITAYKVDESEVVLELDCGDDYGILIGKWGDTLDAIQYLTRLCANRVKANDASAPRVSINIGNYRQKRNQYLREFAGKKAAAVRKYGRNTTLDPMNPYERRIIHTAIQDIEGVTSFSVGNEGERKVVITLEDGVKPLKPQRVGRGGNGRNGRQGGRQNNTVSAPTREKKTDEGAKSVGLYGKLN